MENLPGETAAARRLKTTSLRNFDIRPSAERDDERWRLPNYKFTIKDAPVPALYKYALSLIGCPEHGPDEKISWWVPSTYNGEWCQLAMQKFGLRIYLHTDRGPEQAHASPVFSFSPGSESTIADVFALFDRIDQWTATHLPEATAWIDSGLDVRYDKGFRALLAEARSEGDFDTFLRASELEHDRFVNMDF